jgi:sulfite exporter TauE/SafE
MFMLGLAGSLHCVQMCGPLVLSFGMNAWQGHALYHLGRVFTYAALGAVAGWLGSGMTLVGAMAGITHAAAIVAGALMIAAGLLIFGAMRSNGLVRIGPASRFSRLAGRLLRVKSPRARFISGLAMGLLPCGMIYAALLRSVASASVLTGALAMLAFGLGTAGPLLGLGIFSTTLGRFVNSQRWAAAGIMLMGALLIWRGLVTPEAHMHHMH